MNSEKPFGDVDENAEDVSGIPDDITLLNKRLETAYTTYLRPYNPLVVRNLAENPCYLHKKGEPLVHPNALSVKAELKKREVPKAVKLKFMNSGTAFESEFSEFLLENIAPIAVAFDKSTSKVSSTLSQILNTDISVMAGRVHQIHNIALELKVIEWLRVKLKLTEQQAQQLLSIYQQTLLGNRNPENAVIEALQALGRKLVVEIRKKERVIPAPTPVANKTKPKTGSILEDFATGKRT